MIDKAEKIVPGMFATRDAPDADGEKPDCRVEDVRPMKSSKFGMEIVNCLLFYPGSSAAGTPVAIPKEDFMRDYSTLKITSTYQRT